MCGNGLRYAVAMQASVGLAEIFDFTPPVKAASPVEVLVAPAFFDLLQLLLNKVGIMVSRRMVAQCSAPTTACGLVVAERRTRITDCFATGFQRWQIAHRFFHANERGGEKCSLIAMHSRVHFTGSEQRREFTTRKDDLAHPDIAPKCDDEGALS